MLRNDPDQRPTICRLATSCSALLLAGCLATAPATPGIGAPQPPRTPVAAGIPVPLPWPASLPATSPIATGPTYSVAVDQIDVREVLHALARDAGLNIDIHPAVEGRLTLTATRQTLPRLLGRIARQADLRWQVDGDSISILPDSPQLRTYVVDYVNVSREASGSVQVATQIATAASSPGESAANAGNNSSAVVNNRSHNRFWDTLERNIKELLRETDKLLPEGSSETSVETRGVQPQIQRPRQSGQKVPASEPPPSQPAQEPSSSAVVRRTTFREAASVIVNPETGIVMVRATEAQHDKVQEFLSHLAASARRQVLIEATIAEVSLSSGYQQGVDWSLQPAEGPGTALTMHPRGDIAEPAASFATFSYRNPAARFGNLALTLKWLESFGTVRVISSPAISVINNQTAVLKVVDNIVYFTLKADTVANQTIATTTYTTQPHSVPVGLMITVTPQISEADTVLLTVRPSISRRYGTINDPNPELQRLGITNAIPIIRTRELESVLRVESGQTAVMGGLMEDGTQRQRHGVPLLSDLPVAGSLFQNLDDSGYKTELVILLRPTVIRSAFPAVTDGLHPDRGSDLSSLARQLGHKTPNQTSVRTPGERTDPAITFAVHAPADPTPLAAARQAFSAGDAARASALFAAVADQFPGDAAQALAIVALRRGDAADAWRQCDQARAAAPLHAFAQVCPLLLTEPVAPVAAEARIRSLIGRGDAPAILHFTLASQLAAQDRWAEARAAWLRAGAGQPDDPAIDFNLAICAEHLDRQEEAERLYRQVLADPAALPDDARATASLRLAQLGSPAGGRP
jgi:general secretion pathway protein D